MNLKIGDTVKFLNDVGEGQVTALVDKKTVMVSTPDGFDMPVLISDLIKTESVQESKHIAAPASMPDDDEQENSDEPEEEGPAIDDEIILAIRLKNNSEISGYFVNMSTYHLYYTISQKKEGENLYLLGGKLDPETQVILPKLLPESIDEVMTLYVNVIFFGESFYSPVAPVNKKIEILPSDIYSGLLLKDNDYFDHKAALFPVYIFNQKKPEFTNTVVAGDLKKILEEKEDLKKPDLEKPKEKKPGITEVDLHIQEIVEDFGHLTSGEIIEAQMARFKTALETAIIHRERKIVFIHGIGNGKLKYEIRKVLDREYSDLRYQDASFKEYGYGATMVLIPG